MSYAKFDDRTPDNPKVVGVSLRARWDWFESICYCSGNLTDGRLPAGIVNQRWRRSANELVEARLWDADGDSYQVHDYLDWNDSRDAVHARRDHARRAAQSKARSTARRKPGALPGGDLEADISAPTPSEGLKDYAADAAPEDGNGFLEAPPGISNTQAYFVRKLGGEDHWWPAIHKAKRHHPVDVVTTALGHLAESPPAKIENAYALLEAECQLVGKHELEAAR
jgi:hypothetical protein